MMRSQGTNRLLQSIVVLAFLGSGGGHALSAMPMYAVGSAMPEADRTWVISRDGRAEVRGANGMPARKPVARVLQLLDRAARALVQKNGPRAKWFLEKALDLVDQGIRKGDFSGPDLDAIKDAMGGFDKRGRMVPES